MSRAWTVPEYGPIERLEDNLWSVAGALPGMALRRRMTVVRLADAKLVIHSCMPLVEPAMQQLQAWRVIGSSGPPRITPIARMLLTKDRVALRAHLLELAQTPGLARVVVSHIDVIERDPASTLQRLAGTL
jgi:hypothetical protein